MYFHRGISVILKTKPTERKVEDVVSLLDMGILNLYSELCSSYSDKYRDLIAYGTPIPSIEEYVTHAMENVDSSVNMFRDELVGIKYPMVNMATAYALYDKVAWTNQLITMLTIGRVGWIADAIQAIARQDNINGLSKGLTVTNPAFMTPQPQVQPRVVFNALSPSMANTSMVIEASQFITNARSILRYVSAYHKLKTNPHFLSDEGSHLLNHGLHNALASLVPMVLIDEASFDEMKQANTYMDILKILDTLLVVAAEKYNFEYRDIQLQIGVSK